MNSACKHYASKGSFKSVTTSTHDGISAVQRNGKPNDDHESSNVVSLIHRLSEDSADVEPVNCVTDSRINVLLIERTSAAVYIIIIFELHLPVTGLRDEVAGM